MYLTKIEACLRRNPCTWLVTGAAGFIGSHLVGELLRLKQRVIGLDNFSTGHKHNLEDVGNDAGLSFKEKFTFIEGDIQDLACCRRACSDVDYVLHQAALGSVSRSFENPLTTHAANVTGYLNMILAAKEAKVRGMVYASSSSVYGAHKPLPKVESRIGNPLSPYSVTKRVNELYADIFSQYYGLPMVGLRYFNVFGPRQDPDGPYAAVIPKWILAMLRDEPTEIYGDGRTTRDFCYVTNIVQANILAAASRKPKTSSLVYNVALNRRLSLKRLHEIIRKKITCLEGKAPGEPIFKPPRTGDIRHSRADIKLIGEELGYMPDYDVNRGIEQTVRWFAKKL